MAYYKVTGLTATPVYPAGKTSFLPTEDVIIKAKGTAYRDVTDPSWFSWHTVLKVFGSDGALLASHDQNWVGAPPSLTQQFDQNLNLGKWSAGTVAGYVTAECYG